MVEMNGNGKSESHDSGETMMRETGPPPKPFKVSVSARFLVMSILASMLLAFAVGRAARLILLEGPRHALLVARRQSTLRDRPDYEGMAPPLPSLVAKNGKIPHTRYTSKNFDTARSASSSSWLITNRDLQAMEEGYVRSCEVNGDGVETCAIIDEDDDDDDDDDSQPSGEHLMVDIKNVDSSFLNSEKRLAHAMVNVVNEANLTLLSYHCHGLTPAGVSCVGLLLHNYVSFHTWPVEGVITLDLCSGGHSSILPVLPIIERNFAVPRAHTPRNAKPEMRWAFKLRGFRFDPDESDLYSSAADLGGYILGDLGIEHKKEVSRLFLKFVFTVDSVQSRC